MPKTETNPRYKHDCNNCVFLGQHEEFDLYVCPKADNSISTTVARYSDDGPDYISGIFFDNLGTRPLPYIALKKAFMLAINLGYKLPSYGED